MQPVPDVARRRDARFIARYHRAFAALFERYHDVHVDGWEHVPEGPALCVANHNGGIMSPDMIALMLGWWRQFGPEAPTYGLAHDVPFSVPGLRALLWKVGAVPAHPAHARVLLDGGAKVLVYPGGDLDAFRPHRRRHEVVFGERSGFVKIALRARVPVLPIVGAGAHEGFRVLSDGTWLVRALGLKRHTRIEVLPFFLAMPWGLAVGPLPYVPLPVRMRLRILPPITWPELGPDAADDPATVARCREQVRAAMQHALDELAALGDTGPRVPVPCR
jgi:1-acyl-sn-glycerol-3-phosphate acyltransferase